MPQSSAVALYSAALKLHLQQKPIVLHAGCGGNPHAAAAASAAAALPVGCSPYRKFNKYTLAKRQHCGSWARKTAPNSQLGSFTCHQQQHYGSSNCAAEINALTATGTPTATRTAAAEAAASVEAVRPRQPLSCLAARSQGLLLQLLPGVAAAAAAEQKGPQQLLSSSGLSRQTSSRSSSTCRRFCRCSYCCSSLRMSP